MARKKKTPPESVSTKDDEQALSPELTHEIEDAEVVENSASDDNDITDQGPQETAAPDAPLAETAPNSKSGGGFLGGFLGGALASGGILAGLWALAPNLFRPPQVDTAPLSAGIEEQRTQTDSLKSEIASLKTELQNLQNTPATAGEGFETRLGTLEADLTARIEELSETIGQQTSTLSILEGRLAQVEARPPVFSGDASEETGALIAQMRTALEAQRTEINALADAAQERLEAAEAEAAALRDNTQAATKLAVGRAALSRLLAAMDAGGPFAAPLSDLAEVTGQSMPAALLNSAETGVPTLSSLRETFPDAARAALAATSREGLADDAGFSDRIGAFLKTQTGARSLEPREGDDPDAILSRAEAALADNRIEDAVSLIDQLSETGRDAMAGWRAQADTRIAALSAAQTLAKSLADE